MELIRKPTTTGTFRFTLFFVVLLIAAVCGLGSVVRAQSFSGVLTWHNDVSRTGQNLDESVLTPQNVKDTKFGKVFSYSVDGQIYAQPLYVPNVSIPGQGVHNVVYVETENDSVYAFDADGLDSAPLWQVSLINPAEGITPVPCGTDGDSDISCNVFPIYGITGTPVIDPTSNTMYFVARTAEPTGYYQRLHALDITTGKEEFGGPVVIQGSVPGTGSGSVGGIVTYDPLADIQRTGLLLLNGMVYIGWAGAQHGWIFGYNAQELTQTPVIFNTAPNAVIGGVWGSGAGLAADASGNIYASVGDALFDANVGGIDYGDTVLKMNASLGVEDYFAPMDQACRAKNDMDLGSAGVLLLPTQSGTYPDELVISGKGGNPCDASGASPIYLLNQNDLGQYSATQDQIIEEVNGAPSGYWSNPAFWQGSTGTYIYLAGTSALGGAGDYLKMYSVSNGLLSTAPVAQSTNIFPVGATPSISANGTADGIVWAVERQDSLSAEPGMKAAILYAYDATNVATMLYNSGQDGNRDQLGCGNKFQTPTIADGKVYVGTQTQLDVFGLLGTPSGPAVYLSIPCYTFPKQTVGTTSTAKVVTLKNGGTSTLTFSSIGITGTNSSDFAQSNTCGTSLAAGASCTISVTFTPAAAQTFTGFVTMNDNAVGSPHNIGLIGTGIAGTVSLSPASMNFGKVNVGTTSASKSATLTNTGTIAVAISSIAIMGTDPADFAETNDCPSSLNAGAKCTITVTFAPQVTGGLSASVTVTDNATGSPQTIALTGSGVRPNVQLSPKSLTFGSQEIGTTSAPQNITLTDDGGGTLTISSIAITGTDPEDFAQTNNCPASLPTTGTCTITVTFTPTATGSRTAVVTITDNAASSPQEASLSGTGD
jgi:Abnormal spindle-like microcephaly-assoc'd, ASPM-SPD-2-Hydin